MDELIDDLILAHENYENKWSDMEAILSDLFDQKKRFDKAQKRMRDILDAIEQLRDGDVSFDD